MTDPRADASPGAVVLGTGPGGLLLDRRVVLVAALAALVLFAAAGFVVGADVTERRHDLGGWHAGVAHVGTDVVSVEYGDWVYGASDSIEGWIDRAGSWHDSGWPDCLRVPPGSDVPVRFAAHEVTVDHQTWRPIVAVDCRASDSPAG